MALQLEDPEDSGGARLYPKDILNHLLLVWVIEYIPESPTQYTKPGQACDAVVVDIVDLDLYTEDGQPGLLARKTWWRQARLIRDLKMRVGKPNPILVRMGKAGASTGMNAPFAITTMSADPTCVSRANAWYAANPDFTPSEVWQAPQDVEPAQEWEQQPAVPTSLLPPPRPPVQPSVLEQQANEALTPQQQAMQRLTRMTGQSPYGQSKSGVGRPDTGEPPF